MNCRICDSLSKESFSTKLLKYEVKFYLCENCKFLQSEEPYWLDQAYNDSISILDTGILKRNLEIVNYLFLILSFIEFKKNNFTQKIFRRKPKILLKNFSENLLDFGGGYGILVRLLRDRGINAYWTDKYSKNIFARGFEEKKNENYSVVTAFELLEHLVMPKQEILQILDKYKPKQFIFSTLLYGNQIPSKDWWYYSFETGQHISFYSKETLKYLADIFNMKLYSINDEFHIFSKEEINLKNLNYLIFYKDLYIKDILNIYKSLTFSDFNSLKNTLHISNTI